MQLIPRDEKFYDLFREQAELVSEAAHKLAELFNDFTDVEKRVTEIEFIEHRGDQLTHTVMTKLNKTFITPIDREDIHSLSSALDDVLDRFGDTREVLRKRSESLRAGLRHAGILLA